MIYVESCISGTGNNLFKLRKEGHVCGPPIGREDLGIFDTVTECALSCRNHSTCNHFSYAKFTGLNEGESRRCQWVKTSRPNCPIGFVADANYDFYALSGSIYNSLLKCLKINYYAPKLTYYNKHQLSEILFVRLYL